MTSRIAPDPGPEGSTSPRTHAGHGGIARLLVGGLTAVLIAMILVGVVGLRASGSPGGASALDRVMILGLLVLSLATGIAITAMLAGRLRNLAAVTETARALAAGDLSARTSVRANDEIGLIAEAFNDMADTIEAQVRDERAEHVALEAAVEEFSGFASKVSRGDLTARLAPNRNPALARLAVDLNAMAGALATMSGQVRGASHEMGGATTQILAAVTEHTAATSEQAASIAETSVTVEEVRATSEQAARRAQDVAAQAVKVAEVADEGLSAVDGIVQAMTAIQTRVERIAADILTLSEQSHAIGAITQTVNDLADQSNMLALNATIEAAKAGEQGRGFAVVAQEVRSLAEQSKAATAQVHGILGQIQAATRAAVVATEEGTTAVVDGTQRARRAGDAIERLTATMRDTAASASAIAASAREQHSGMDQIAHAINDVAATTHQIARGASDTQLAAVSLREVADRLDELTRRYTLASDIGRARPARTAPAPRAAATQAPAPTPVPVA